MVLRTPNATPLIGVLLVVFIAVATDWRLLTVRVPQPIDCECADDQPAGDTTLRVRLRSDLSARMHLFGSVHDEVDAPDVAPTLRRAMDSAQERGLSEWTAVIYVEADDEVRWGDLVSMFDTMRGVAPDAFIALDVPRSTTEEDLR